MKVGLFINTQFPEGDNIAARVPELVEQVRVARQSGFASVLFPHQPEIVKTLAGSGAAVVVNSRGTQEELDEVVSACREKGVEAFGVIADVSTAEG